MSGRDLREGKLWPRQMKLVRSRGDRRRSLVADSILLSVLLVIATTLAFAGIAVVVIDRQIEATVDRRLADGAYLFQVELEDSRDDIEAVGNWLTRDRELISALEQHRLDDLRERLMLALRLQAVDEVVAADARGEVMTAVRMDGSVDPAGIIGDSAGFRQALAGRLAYGLARSDEDFLRQTVYLSVHSAGTDLPVGIVRVASFLDAADLDRFRAHAGLDASVFFEGQRVVTTLSRDGVPLTEVGPDPFIYDKVVGKGQKVTAWRDLPIGRVRSFYAPLDDPEGKRIGMYSVSLPVSSIAGELWMVLRVLLPAAFAIALAGGSLTYLVARRVRKPLTILAGAAARLRDGDLETPVPLVRERELAPVAEQLELARTRMKANMETVTKDISRHAELNRLREQLLHDVSHELRGPLAILHSTLDVVAESYDEMGIDELDHLLGSARRVTGRLIGLIEDLLSAGNIQRGSLCWKPSRSS